MIRMATTNQKKKTTMPGIAYPATVLALATVASYPGSPDLFRYGALAPGRRDLRLMFGRAGGRYVRFA
jgi:hypothetical protein